jgi:hypothetical protein
MSTYAINPNFELNQSIEESRISLTCDISFPSDLGIPSTNYVLNNSTVSD